MSATTSTPDNNNNNNNTTALASAFVKSYGSAIALTQNPNITAQEISAALVRHYAPTFTAYDHGYTIVAPANDANMDFWLTGVTTHLKRFQKSGLGWDMQLSDFRVEVVGKVEAKCHVTWSIKPLDREGWAWTNVYVWRDEGEVGEDGLRGFFGSVASDDETEQLMQRVPGFMQLEV
jgi:hypothetical protein